MKWARMFKKSQSIRLQIVAVLAIIFALLSLVTLTACQDNSAGNMTNSNENNANDNDMGNNEIKHIYAIIGEEKIEIELSQNIATNALVEKLREGDITYTARDYGGFEKVGNIGMSLPASDADINARAGDVMLYQGNQILR